MNFQLPKINKFFIIFIIILLFIILINIMFGTYSPVPYSPENIFSKQFPYNKEGFKENNTEDDKKKKKNEILIVPEGFKEKLENGENVVSSNEDDENVVSSNEDNENVDLSNNIIKTEKKITNKDVKENFQGLKYGSFLNEDYKGTLVNNNISPSCGSNSNGLSTTRGYVCLSPTDISYLQSRGGNATSKGEF